MFKKSVKSFNQYTDSDLKDWADLLIDLDVKTTDINVRFGGAHILSKKNPRDSGVGIHLVQAVIDEYKVSRTIPDYIVEWIRNLGKEMNILYEHPSGECIIIESEGRNDSDVDIHLTLVLIKKNNVWKRVTKAHRFAKEWNLVRTLQK